MCLFSEMLGVKKCRNLSGEEYFPITVNSFPYAENLDLLFCSTAFIDKIIRRNIIRIYFISWWLIWRNNCRKRERSANVSLY